jgi:5-methylcytosine-specific restriction enzyme subunit McrC
MVNRSAQRPAGLPTVTLSERGAAECRLCPADAAFLRTVHAGHVELAPILGRDRYRLRAFHHVGTIVCTDCRLVIRPKIPLRSLFALLDPDDAAPAVADETATEAGAEGLDFLAGWLARLLAARAAAGLRRAYAERAGDGPFLQGRLDVSSQVRAPAGRKDRLHSRWDDLSADVPCNQVPAAAAERVLASPLLGEGARGAIRRALRPFAAMSPVPLTPESFARALSDVGDPAAREAYRPLLELCRVIAETLAPRPEAGPAAGPAFLLDMERVFERYCAGQIAAGLPARFAVRVQPHWQAGRSVSGGPDLHVRPDLVLQLGGKPALVVDAKWKRPPRAALATADVYQVLAYCTALGARRAALVYPGRRDRAWDYRLARSDTRLSVFRLRVVGSRDQLRRSVRRLVRSLTSTPRKRQQPE